MLERLMRGTIAVLLAAPLAVYAQTASGDWNGSYNFITSSRQQINLMQADFIAKREADYYSGLGKSIVTIDNRQGSFNTVAEGASGVTIDADYAPISSTTVGQQSITNNIGTYTNPIISIDGSGNSVSVGSTSTGSQSSTIDVNGLTVNASGDSISGGAQ